MNKKLASKVNDMSRNLVREKNKIPDKVIFTLNKFEDLGHNFTKEFNIHESRLIVCEVKKLSYHFYERQWDDFEKEPLFFICQDENKRFSVFCILKFSNDTSCLYTDFTNTKIPKKIESELKKIDENIKVRVYYNNEEKVEEDINFMILQTLQQMMIKSNEDRKSLIESFADPQKSFMKNWKENMSLFKARATALAKEKYEDIFKSNIDKLSKQDQFLRDLKEFMTNIPICANEDYITLCNKYATKMENNVSGDDLKSLSKELEEARKSLFNTNFFQNVSQTSQQNIVIYDKYPEQMKMFDEIFEKLQYNEKRFNVEGQISEIARKLKLDEKTLSAYFKSKKKPETSEENKENVEKSIDDLIRQLPTTYDAVHDDISKNKSFDQLILEIQDTLIEEKMINVEIIYHLERSYQQVKDFHESWKNRSAKDVHNWAISKDKNLQDSEIFEAIAIMNRANSLTTGGHNLRDTQILSILSFFYQSDKGLLAQIQTGEGKTTIVAILAAIKALQGKTVDIITSNPILAQDGLDSKKVFYNLLGLTVATNNLDEKYVQGERKCYKSDVVYGGIGNFQFDFLKDSFLGYKTRAARKFGAIILDEVDSMIIDNASHIAKLSGPFPGMDSLKYVYLKIWMKLSTAEDEIHKRFQVESELKRRELTDRDIEDEEAQELFEKFVFDFGESSKDKIFNIVKSSNPSNVEFIPSHIRDYAEKSVEKWINSAIDAKYNYKQNVQYVIPETGEKSIQPVDYSNTGVTLKNTIWQNGLHQFLQLKHRLRLTSESLTSCFISNLSYIKKYGKQIYGLTGTLGSDAEKDLISSIYDVQFIRMPTYREKRFHEYEGEVIDDEIFISNVAEESLAIVSKNRSCLVICETIKDAMMVKSEVEKFSGFEIKTFFFEEDASVTKAKVKPKTVLIATNIAGRGTDLETSDELEKNGGLHVCVTFLPRNVRVEDQAFGRTARQGKHGSAQLLIRKSEVSTFDIDYYNMENIKNIRDCNEKLRIAMLKSTKVKELEYQDELFELFSKLYNTTKSNIRKKEGFQYVLEDLKEFWAFWLSDQDFKNPEKLKVSPKEFFEDFKTKSMKNVQGEINFNPYYCIKQAECLILSKKFDDAETSLKHAIDMTKNHQILYSAYMKLFEISLERGGVVMFKFKNILAEILGEKLGNALIDSCFQSSTFDKNYKSKALKNLEKAKGALKNEIDYVEKLQESDEFKAMIYSVESDDQDFQNLFLKHFESRQKALQLNMHHAQSLVQQLSQNCEFSINERNTDIFINLEPKTNEEKIIKETILKDELKELAAVGQNVTYNLKESQELNENVMRNAKIQIFGGLVLCLSPFTTGIGTTLMTEGISEIATELIHGSSDFSWKAYVKAKVMSFGLSIITSIITWGFSAIMRCKTIFDKAEKAFRAISKYLKSVKGPLSGVCKYLAKNICDRPADWCRNMKYLANYSKMSNAAKALHMEKICFDPKCLTEYNLLLGVTVIPEVTSNIICIGNFSMAVKNVAVSSTKQLVMGEVVGRMVTAVTSELMSVLKPKIAERVEKCVNEKIDKEKLKFNDMQDIQNALKDIKESLGYKDLLGLVMTASLELSKHCNHWKTEISALVIDQFTIWYPVYNFTSNACEKLNKKLNYSDSEKCSTEQVEGNVKTLCQQFSEELFQLIVSSTIKTCKDVYTIGKSAYQNYENEAAETAKCVEKIKDFENDGPTGQEEIKAFCDMMERPVHLCDENGNVIVKLRDDGRYSVEPIKVVYHEKNDDNPNGHYTPLGKDRNWQNQGKNNCFFDSIAASYGLDATDMREKTVEKMRSDPQRYIALNVHESSSIDILMKGGCKMMPKTQKEAKDILENKSGHSRKHGSDSRARDASRETHRNGDPVTSFVDEYNEKGKISRSSEEVQNSMFHDITNNGELTKGFNDLMAYPGVVKIEGFIELDQFSEINQKLKCNVYQNGEFIEKVNAECAAVILTKNIECKCEEFPRIPTFFPKASHPGGRQIIVNVDEKEKGMTVFPKTIELKNGQSYDVKVRFVEMRERGRSRDRK